MKTTPVLLLLKLCRPVVLIVGLIFCACQGEKRSNSVATSSQHVMWERLGPGGGGSTFVPKFSYHSPQQFILRCDMTGTYLTSNGGESYRQVNVPNGSVDYAYDPNDSTSVWLSSTSLHHSLDGGETWQRVFPKQTDVLDSAFEGDHASFSLQVSEASMYNRQEESIDNLRVDPAVNGSLYFSMGSYFYYSRDVGRNWDRIDIGQPVLHIYTNRTSLQNTVLIFTSSDVVQFDKSTASVVQTTFPRELTPAVSIAAGVTKDAEQTLIYALHHEVTETEFNRSRIWRSTDGGNQWEPIGGSTITNTGYGALPSLVTVACAEYDADYVYVVTDRYEEGNADGAVGHWYGALNSADRGNHWQWVWKGGGGSGQYGVKDGKSVSNLKDAWVEDAFGGEYIRLLDVGVFPADGRVAVVTDWYRAMKTLDGGRTWEEIYSKRDSDGGFKSRGLDVTTAYNVHFDPFDGNHVAISYTDIGYHHSYDGGETWHRSVVGVPNEWVNTCYDVTFDPDVKGKMWSVWSGLHDFPRGKMMRSPQWRERGKGGVCVSEDGGRTWRPVTTGMGQDAPSTSVVVDPRTAPGNRTLYVAGFTKGVFKSTDDGRTWRLMNNGLGPNTCAFELTLASDGSLYLTVTPTPVHRDGIQGREYYSGALYKSSDGAETWTRLNVVEGPLFPNGVAVDPHNPNRIYLACWSRIQLSDLVGGNIARSTGGNMTIDMPGGIFLSEDGGSTWSSIFDQRQYVYDVTIDPYHEGRLYCNTFNRAAFRSDDWGRSWQQLGGYDFHWGHRVIPDAADSGYVYITTYGSSVWRGKPEP